MICIYITKGNKRFCKKYRNSKNHVSAIDNHVTVWYNYIKIESEKGGEYVSATFPGTTIEISKLEKGCSKQLFDSIFVTGGLTLSQVCVMTGLEPYLIQNWVKRGFVSSPVRRTYSPSQFARIIIINMLRESLQIDQICELISITTVTLHDERDDIIKDDDLYHRYVDMIADNYIDIGNRASVEEAANKAADEFEPWLPIPKKEISGILQVMAYAHFAGRLKKNAQDIFSSL